MDLDYSLSYIGTVIRNSDISYSNDGSVPAPAGRVLVRIDGVSFTNKDDRTYKFPIGSNVSGGLDKTDIKRLEQTDVLCYVGAPITGSDGIGRYHAKQDIATISESNDTSIWNDGSSIGYAPASMFDRISDIFSTVPEATGTPVVNTYGKSYMTDYRSNQAHGTHAIPSIGARVVVQFLNGSRHKPFVSHVLHGSYDISNIRGTATTNAYPGVPNIGSTVAV